MRARPALPFGSCVTSWSCVLKMTAARESKYSASTLPVMIE